MNDQPQNASPNARFLAGDVSTSRLEVKKAGNATIVSFAIHVAFVALVLLGIANSPAMSPPPESDRLPNDIIWLDQPGPGGGGGCGGNKMPEPPRRAELKGVEKITVPVPARKPESVQAKQETPKPPVQLDIPAQPTATGVMELPGMISNLPAPSVSQGMGEGGGSGTGRGTGIGPGRGSGLGDGTGGGTGGGAYQPGNGVTSPVVIREKTPEYTSDAMRAKIQGTVEVEAIVMPDGSVGQIRIVRSLDDRFGLDQKAVEAVRQWRFEPGRRQGQPVAVIVTIELTFTLR